jgi:uncharacterized membrane protein YeaQ/YmgE (transglycosylase-associated protein family)
MDQLAGKVNYDSTIGGLGKFVAPGERDNIPLWLTIVCGIGGVLIGYYLAALGVEATRGIDWTRWIIGIVAAVLVMIAASVTGRRGRGIYRVLGPRGPGPRRGGSSARVRRADATIRCRCATDSRT